MVMLLLRNRELCVCDFEGVLGISQSKASRHLRYLRNAGLLTDRKEGLWVYYQLADDESSEFGLIFDALEQVIDGKTKKELSDTLSEWLKNKEKSDIKCALIRNERKK